MRLGRKGISNVVAAMLLILISVSGATLLYTYASGVFGPLQGAQPQQSYMEQVALEYYNWTGPNPAPLQIRMRNVGSASILIKDVFISGTIVPATSISWGAQCTNGVLSVQSSCLVTLPAPSALTPGVAYSVSFVSSTGGKTTFSLIYQQSG